MKWWWNGQIIDELEAVIPLADHGFLYGMGLFETFRTYNGRPFLLARHMERLLEGCEELRIKLSLTQNAIETAISALLEANGLQDGSFRLSVSGGVMPYALPPVSGYESPNVSIAVKPIPANPPQPKELHLLTLARSTPEGAVRRKSFHYMNNILGKWELAERFTNPSAEGLFMNEDGIVVEGITSNVFHIQDGTLYTPSLLTGCLPGVTRWAVMELAAKHKLKVVESRYGWRALQEADELFVTNSIQEIVPVICLIDSDGSLRKEWPAEPGPYTRQLQTAYQEWIERG